MRTVHIWNLKFSLVEENGIAEQVQAWLKAGRRNIQITGVDSNVAQLAQNNAMLAESINDSDIVNVDSYWPAWGLRRNGINQRCRIPTPDVFEALLKSANENRQKVFLLGAKDFVVEKVAKIIFQEYPDLKIVGYRNGYYSNVEEKSIAMDIGALAPDFLFLALPSPKKELFIKKYKRLLNVGCFYGIGGAFDAKVGLLKRPPKSLRHFCIESMFRVIKNPKVYLPRVKKQVAFVRLICKRAKYTIEET